MRLFQGISGAGGIVLSKSISTDMFSGRDLQKFMAIISAINGIAPIIAPMLGGTIAHLVSWQGIFIILLAIGIILMIMSIFLKETLLPEKRSKGNIANIYSNLFKVFHNPIFTLSVLGIMFCFVTFFGYLSSSTFILQKTYGLSPFEYSLCFGLNAIIIAIGAILGGTFKHPNTILKWSSINMFIGTILVSICLVNHLSLTFLMLSYAYLMFSFGLMQAPATAVALDSERQHAGAASASFGASCFLAGAIASPLVSLGNMLISTSIVLTIGSLICMIISQILAKRIKRQANQD